MAQGHDTEKGLTARLDRVQGECRQQFLQHTQHMESGCVFFVALSRIQRQYIHHYNKNKKRYIDIFNSIGMVRHLVTFVAQSFHSQFCNFSYQHLNQSDWYLLPLWWTLLILDVLNF